MNRRPALCLLLLLLADPSCALARGRPGNGVSGERALNHVRALVRLGERTPGSQAHRQAQDYILRHLRSTQAEIEEVDFKAETPHGSVRMKNIIGKFPGQSSEIVVLGGHYDTLKLAGFVGANDGGSSTALLLELARVLGQRERNPLTVWVVFFDGEEAFVQWSARDGFYGSRYQASVWEQAGVLKGIRAVIVVDMIADRDLAIRRELNSTPWLTDLVWQVARAKGHRSHFLNEQTSVADDHIPFVQAGVPAVDLIDLDYGPGNSYWHTPADTVDKLDARSFEVVADVVLETLRRLGQRWPAQASN